MYDVKTPYKEISLSIFIAAVESSLTESQLFVMYCVELCSRDTGNRA